MSDNYNNNIGHKCSASKFAGFNRHLVTGEGTIEMIRKTPYNLVEEFQIQGNRLIDGDGVWCYQIPMNLDYVGTDEFGNIVPTDNPKKGIPTRTSVRFRVSMQETGNEGVSRHRAKYLIPNVQELDRKEIKPTIQNPNKFDSCYEFGSATPDEYYRDLYWNKVYSVKNYIPRIQTNNKNNTQNYSAIRTVNSNNDVNPVPFNHARFRLAFGYRVLCMLMTIVFLIICAVNGVVSGIACFKLPLGIGRIFKWLCRIVSCVGVDGGLTEDEETNIEYFPCCSCNSCAKCKKKGCTKEKKLDKLMNVVQQSLSQEYDTVNLDFYNDWLNGSLYMPLWFWKKTKKKKFLFGLFSKKAVNSFCSCNQNFSSLRVTQNCSLNYKEQNYEYVGDLKGNKYHDSFPKDKPFTLVGVIKEFVNKAGLNIYYYAPGLPNELGYKDMDKSSYVRLYSTDIILLGSLNSCDLDNYPNVFTNLPTTTANVPFIATIRKIISEDATTNSLDGNAEDEGYVEITGMDWLNEGESGKPKYGLGLFIDLACNTVNTKPKSCINLERLCELGVTLDGYAEVPVVKNGNLTYDVILADGMITRYEIVDNESRAMFASLNNNGFTEKIYNPNTGYDTYKLRYSYPLDFDGRMKKSAEAYTSMMQYKTYDVQNHDYVAYRFGLKSYDGNVGNDEDKLHFYSNEGKGYSFPLFNNSFYFYFGIHEGSTAIDKFNSKFYATCYKNEKYPFVMDVKTEAAKWCPNKNTDYGTIQIKLNGIKLPFSYELLNEFDEVILSENGISSEELNFGYKIINDGGAYDLDNNNELIKNGIFTEFLTNKPTNYKVENGTYKLTITDNNGNIGKQNIIIEQSQINLIYESISLGEKNYGNGISNASDFCNENKFYGEIRISGVTLDGKGQKIEQVQGSNGEYFFTLTDESTVKIEIVPQNTNDNKSFSECTCNGVGGINEFYYEGEVIIFPVWKPDNYSVTVTQICNGELNDNVSNFMISIQNGKPFTAFINDVPLKFILGKNENWNNYNTNFYPKQTVNEPTDLLGWFKLHKEETYRFSAATIDNKEIWSDFVTITTEQNEENENDDKTYLTEESLFNILEYKFDCMFNMAKNSYVIGDTDNIMKITHTGGKSPVLYRGNYPEYSDFEGNETPSDVTDGTVFMKYTANSEGSVTCDNNYPNIVSTNYSYVHPTSGKTELVNPNEKVYFNTIYNDANNLGNYFAAFTVNGSITEKITDNSIVCVLDKNKKYQQIPYKASPMITTNDYEITCISADSNSNDTLAEICYKGNNQYKPYFRGEFVDRRLDYDFFIFTPYNGDDLPMISSKDKGDWKAGRFSGRTINGVEMAYDNEYNIIGNNIRKYEYSYNIPTKYSTDDVKTIYNTNSYGNRRFYKTILTCGNKRYDINDYYWRTGKKPTGNKNYPFEIVDHKNDEALYNGDFNETNYPMHRLLDIKGIPSCNKISFNASSCSYNTDLTQVDNGDTIAIKAITEEIGEVEFTVDCRNIINPQLSSLEECAANDFYNVGFRIENHSLHFERTFPNRL